MKIPLLPANEPARLKRLHSLNLLDTPAEDLLDGFTRLAAHITGMPIALLSLIDGDRQWFKSAVGLPQGGQAPRAVSFCGHAIGSPDLFEIEDSRADPRFVDNPLVTGQPHVVHYAGVPLVMPGGEAIGTLSVIGPQPGRLEAGHRALLRELASNVVKVLLLRENERNLDRDRGLSDAAELADLAPIGMFSVDAAGGVLHGSPQWQRVFGTDAMPGTTIAGWKAAIHPGDLPAVNRGWQAATAAREPYVGLFRVRGAAGEDGPRWIKMRLRPVDARFAPVAFVGTAADVTQTVQLEQELQAKNERLERAVEASGLGLWEYDLQSGEVYLSQGWARLLDLPARDSRRDAGQMMQMFPAHEHVRIRAGMVGLLKGEANNLSLEHEVVGSNGRRIWFLTEAQVIARSGQGRALMVVGTCKDVTARVQADAALRAAMQAADQASQAKSDFLATMSHEIRTPLNGVIGMTHLLAAADLPATERDSVAVIDSCAKSLLSLVDNILDFSKIEAGRLTLDEAPLDLRELVREVADVFTARAADKGLRFLVQTEARVPRWIQADRGRLRQILLNLLGNALKFTDVGGFTLAVGRCATTGGECLTFAVSDTGIGIDAADQPRLFTRFTQVDGSASRNHHGTGLGLAISRQLAQLMWGDVTLVSRPHAGSTFTLRVPLCVAAAQDTVRAAMSAAVRVGAHILVAEDNEINQLVARRLLQSLGYQRVTMANDGSEAVAACERQAFDLILMDCQMPGTDGWEATRQLRAQGVRTPVLALTAGATSGDREKCLQAGMDDYLTKPIELAVLADKINRWLDAPVPPAAAPTAPLAPEPEPAPVAFDPAVVAHYFMGDRAMFAQVRQLFLNQTRLALPAMRAACDDGDVATLKALAHRIRGTAATVGAGPLAAACKWIDEAEDPAPAELAAALDAIEAGFEGFEVQSGVEVT